MRPLRRAPSPSGLGRGFAVDHLMEQLGTYCSLCERPLLTDNFIWNRETGEVSLRRVDAADWHDLLVVCHNCAASQERTRESVTGPLLLPDEATTFSLEGESPFSYSLRSVERRIIGEDGEPVAQPERVEVAIVSGATPGAANTIARFELNTPYYDDRARTLSIPLKAYQTLADRRLDLRTRAWRDAEIAAATLPKLDGWRSNPHYHRLLLRLIEAAGFWSVWATVLWPVVRDRDLLQRLMIPSVPAAGVPDDHRVHVPEPASRIRGTAAHLFD